MLPGSRSRITLTLRQLWWGTLTGAVALTIITPILGTRAGLSATCNVVLVTVAAFEADHRGYLRPFTRAAVQLLVTASAAVLVTFVTSLGLLDTRLTVAAEAAGLSAAALVLALVVLGRISALFRSREQLVAVN